MTFEKKAESISIIGNDVIIDIKKIRKAVPIEIRPVIKLIGNVPKITVFEDKETVISYIIEPKHSNLDLNGQYLHMSVRVLQNFAVMMDGIISKSKDNAPSLAEEGAEGIRFQPFFLSFAETDNETFIGQGLFNRGLHFSGTVTNGNIRLCCVCDFCKMPFNIQSFHAGFSDGQYFYSSDGSVTLFVSNGDIDNMPGQLAQNINLELLKSVESKLPKPINGTGEFKYYNAFRCPHCKSAYIDFEKYPENRPQEYYGNTYVNGKIQKFNSK